MNRCPSIRLHVIIALMALVCSASPLRSGEVRFRRFGLAQGLPQSYVTRITQDMDGYLWVGTQDGLARYDGKTFAVYRRMPGDVHSIPSGLIHSLYVGKDSVLYAGTGDGNARYDRTSDSWKRLREKELPPPLRLSRLREANDPARFITLVDRKGREWTGTHATGLLVRDRKGRTLASFGTCGPVGRRLASDDILSMIEDSRGRIWVGMHGGGLAVIDSLRVTAAFRHEPGNAASLSGDVINALFEDRGGNLWIGTHGGGLCQYDPYAHLLPVFRPTTCGLPVRDDFIRAIEDNGDGRLLVAVRSGIAIVDTAFVSARSLLMWNDRYPSIGTARALYKDSQGTVWIGTERAGVGVLSKGRREIAWLPRDSPSKRPFTETVSFIGEYDADHVIIGTDGGIAVTDIRTRRSRWFDTPRIPDVKEPRITVSTCVRAEDGTWLLGTEYGLFRGRFGGSWKKLVCPDTSTIRPNIDIIRSVCVHNGQLLVATWGGGVRVIRLADGSERVIDSRSGLPNNTVYSVVPGADGRVVATTNAGVVLLDGTDLQPVRILTSDHGAQSNEFNSWSYLRLPSGTVVAGGIEGLNRIRTDALPELPSPQVIITIDSTSSQSYIVRFHVPAMSSVEPLSYRYATSTDDATWTATTAPEMHISRSDYGRYVIRVQARYGFGAYGPPSDVVLAVAAPIWRSWWFSGGSIALGGLGIWLLAIAVGRRRANRRFESERLVNEERVRIARDLHDDVGSGLAKIVIMAETVEAAEDPTAARSIADTARQVIDSVRSIVWVMKATDNTLSHTVDYLRDVAADIMNECGIAFTVDVSVTDRPIKAIMMRNLILSVKETMTNIVRHSKASAVSMRVWSDAKTLTVDIRDNGTGFEPGKNHRGSGMRNIHERMQELGGETIIDAGSDSGTHIRLVIPFGEN